MIIEFKRQEKKRALEICSVGYLLYRGHGNCIHILYVMFLKELLKNIL